MHVVGGGRWWEGGLMQGNLEKAIRPSTHHLFIQHARTLYHSLSIYKHFFKFSKNIKPKNVTQSCCGKKSVNLQLIATEGISTVLDLDNYP